MYETKTRQTFFAVIPGRARVRGVVAHPVRTVVTGGTLVAGGQPSGVAVRPRRAVSRRRCAFRAVLAYRAFVSPLCFV